MDVKITKGRFANLIAYDLVKIIISIIAAIMVWVLLFTMCATRATVGEQFGLIVFDGVYYKDNYAEDVILKLKKEKSLSYDVLTANVSKVTAAGNYSALYMLTLKASTKEGDVFVFNGKTEQVKDEKGNLKTDESGAPVLKLNDNAQSIVNSSYLVSFTEYLDAAKQYLDKFVTDGTVDENVVKNYFLDYRIKSAGNYRKTFRTQEQKDKGVKLEIERINTLLDNYTLVSGAIENAKAAGVDILWYADFCPGETYEKKNVPYGIDLYKLNAASATSGGEKLSDYWYYWEAVENKNESESGSSDLVKKSDGLTMAVFNYGADQFDLQFESLAVIADAIKTFSNYAA